MMKLSVLVIATSIAAISSGDVMAFEGGVVVVDDGPTHQSSSVMMPGTMVMNPEGTAGTYQAVDSFGQIYSIYVNGVTGEVLASSNAVAISNQLTSAQMVLAADKYNEGVGAMAVPLVPIAVGAGLCYGNDALTKWQMRSHCESSDSTVHIMNSGFCGFNASYRCESRPRPEDEPPTTPPDPDEDSIFGFYADGSFGPIFGTNWAGSNVFDSDWFICLAVNGCD